MTILSGNEKGSIFPATMIAMFLMVLMAGFMFQTTTHDMRFVGYTKKSAQAIQLADAGLARALATLDADWDSKDNAANFPLTTLGPGTYDASVAETGGRVLVSSVGTVDNAQRTVTAEVTAPTVSALNYLLAGGSDVDLRLTAFSTVSMTGQLYAVDDIEMRATAAGASIVIQTPGDVYAGDDISSSGNVTTGTLYPNSSDVVGFPVMDFSYYQTIAAANGYYYTTDQTYDAGNPLPAAPAGGILFVDGDITISSTQTTTACIVATGGIDITQGTTTITQFGSHPALLTQNGSITLRSVGAAVGGQLVAMGLVYSGNNFSLSGNHNTATVTGSIIARGTLEVSGTQCSLALTYVAQDPPGMFSSGGQPMTVESYNR